MHAVPAGGLHSLLSPRPIAAQIMKMALERIFPILNQMEAEGVIGRYAIGGAVGAFFWLEPFPTEHLDVFVVLPTAPVGTLLALSPIYDYLLARGFQSQGQFILIEGWLVEFVPPATPLVMEALVGAVARDVSGTTTRVFTAEHLAPIRLQVGRARDRDRIQRFIDTGVLDANSSMPFCGGMGCLRNGALWNRLLPTYDGTHATDSGSQACLAPARRRFARRRKAEDARGDDRRHARHRRHAPAEAGESLPALPE
jgi:hypothetical protein